MNFLNFTFFKNMTTRIKNSYYCLKLRKKALVLFLLFGTCLTIPLAAISSILHFPPFSQMEPESLHALNSLLLFLPILSPLMILHHVHSLRTIVD